MENKIKIGIDIDEVVVELIKPFLDYSNNKNKTSFSIRDIETYHLWETPIHNSKEESINEVMEFLMSPHFDMLEFVAGALDALKKLGKRNDLFFITSRPKELKSKTLDMLNQNLEKIPFEVFFSGEIHGGRTKSEICADKGISVMIEDNATYALDCAQKEIKVFLLEKPWNRNYQKHQNIIKVKNWQEILQYLK